MYLKILEKNNNNSETYRVLHILYTSYHHEYKVHFML